MQWPLSEPRRATMTLMLVLACIGVAVSPDALHGFDRHVLPKEALLHVAAVIVVLGGWVGFPRKEPIGLLAFVFCGLSFVSSVFAQNPWVAFRSSALTLSATLLFQASRLLSGAGQTARLLEAVAWASVTCALPVLLESFGVIDGVSTVGRAPSGTFGNRNAMAHTVALAIPAMVWTLSRTEHGFGRAARVAGLAIVAAALLLSRCRSAWLGLGCACVLLVVLQVVAFTKRRPLQMARVGWVALGVSLGTGIALMPNELRWRSETPYVDSLRSFLPGATPGLEHRVAQANFTLDMALDANLLGVGPGNFRVQAPRYAALARAKTPGLEQTIPRLPNNDWLGVWAERGAFAVLSLVMLGGALARELMRSFAAARSESIVGLTTLVVLLPMAWFDAVLTQAAPVAFAAVCLGGLTPMTPQTRGLRVWGWLVAAVALVALGRSGLQLWAGHLYSARPLSLERLTLSAELDPANQPLQRDLAELWIGRGDCARASQYVERLKALYPHDRGTQRVSTKCAE